MVGIRCIGLFTKELYPFVRKSVDETINRINGFQDYYILKEIIANKFNDAGKNSTLPSPLADEKLSSLSGYRSVHYDLRLKPDSIVAALEQELLDVPFELQIRTYSQHMVDDVSHFLSYKSDGLFFSAEKFEQQTAKLQNELTSIQAGIDELFEESRKKFDSILRSAQDGDITELLEMEITPDSLKLYALYEFVILKNKDFRGLPKRTHDAKFVELWLNELSDGLKDIGLTCISDVQMSTRRGIEFAINYSRKSTHRKSIFKERDLTDILSKCLLFSEKELRERYPILQETKENIEEFIKSQENLEESMKSQSRSS